MSNSNLVPVDQIAGLVLPALGDTIVMVGITMVVVVAVGVPIGALVHNTGRGGLFEDRKSVV